MYALILAGGTGSRLWPISTINKPKQYLNLYSNNIMINETIKQQKVITLEGNSSDRCKENTYDINSASICGYGDYVLNMPIA